MAVRVARDEERTVRTGGVRRMTRVAGAGEGARWPDDEDELEESVVHPESELESAAHEVVGRELAGAVSAALAVEGWRSAAA